jgi:putative FmdB family regulatory protein
MPLYEYRCSKCHQVFEVLQKFSDAPLATHEECGGEVERLISAPGFQFKGSGWYITDYKNSNSGAKKSEGAKDDGKSGGKSGEKKESKTAAAETAKAESKPAAASKSSE